MPATAIGLKDLYQSMVLIRESYVLPPTGSWPRCAALPELDGCAAVVTGAAAGAWAGASRWPWPDGAHA